MHTLQISPAILIKVYDFVFTVNLENRLKETVMEGQVQKADQIISYWSSPMVKMNGLVSIQKMNYEELKFFGKLPELQSGSDYDWFEPTKKSFLWWKSLNN